MVTEHAISRHGCAVHLPSQPRAHASRLGTGGSNVRLQAAKSLPRQHGLAIRRLAVSTGALPRLIQCTWQPPTEPEAPRVSPEYTPPSDPGTQFRPPPEYAPPEQRPDEETRRGDRPMRPIRPDQEPNIPDPESPNADPVRTPERRKEIIEPTPQERPDERPERE